ncbi:uncharacterized protein THITE_2169703 [Thermothielavioides terrestris NRRL 8126]|uniref:Uncharacterized protein n=1 Tax=Thermothielavioides terrestris (strain ATCC 38088 / NRRL 8126) TaxID=578455 RepID=G2QU34_THETT|nr:uncharacterized protein THITE_2169703 [Thermothielavioides terrestris NRRL 8126]AEO64495.1 hypothetical protein THITE_2169703 [Thermothielavioides terrestris NRRL 8126]
MATARGGRFANRAAPIARIELAFFGSMSPMVVATIIIRPRRGHTAGPTGIYLLMNWLFGCLLVKGQYIWLPESAELR